MEYSVLPMTSSSSARIKLNPQKCRYNMSEIKFRGHIVSAGGLKADPDKVGAIVQMGRPTDKEAIKRLRGTVVPRLSEVMRPITVLTHKGVEWSWGEPQEAAFCDLKRLLTEAPVLAYFYSDKQLVVQCDASAFGIGAALLQDGRPVAYASRALSDTESRYAAIEKEMLAVVFALERWHQFTYGRFVIVNSDHKPLQAITRKYLDRAPKRLQGMLMRALAYDVEIRYLKGKQMCLADTLSHAFLPNTVNQQSDGFEVVNAVSRLPVTEERSDRIRRTTDQGCGNDFFLGGAKVLICLVIAKF